MRRWLYGLIVVAVLLPCAAAVHWYEVNDVARWQICLTGSCPPGRWILPLLQRENLLLALSVVVGSALLLVAARWVRGRRLLATVLLTLGCFLPLAGMQNVNRTRAQTYLPYQNVAHSLSPELVISWERDYNRAAQGMLAATGVGVLLLAAGAVIARR